jgi:methionyl-tRNA formyltransferase
VSAIQAKLSFFLMTQKGLHVLRAFVDEFGASRIHCVIGSKDESVQNDYYAEIADLCAAREIEFRDRSSSYVLETDYAFAISWRWKIQTSVRLIVFHDSLLPRYRGFAPLPTALINGEDRIGVTALFATDEYDRGDIILQKSLSVSYPIKIQKAIEISGGLYAGMVSEISQTIFRGDPLPFQKQDESTASYSLWRDEEDYLIDWFASAARIKRFVDSVGYPYRGAVTGVNAGVARVLEAEVEPDVKIEERMPGKVIFVRDGCPVVVCGSGLLKITDLRDDKGHSLLPLKRFRSRFANPRRFEK